MFRVCSGWNCEKTLGVLLTAEARRCEYFSLRPSASALKMTVRKALWTAAAKLPLLLR